MSKSQEKKKNSRTNEPSEKRAYLRQADVPTASLDEALRIPQAILDHYAGKPTPPLYVAKALNVDPKGSQLRVLSGAAIAFGLVEGGSQAATIAITELARRVLRPKEEGADSAAKRESVLKPRVFGEFLRTYDGHPFPRQDIAINVLEGMGVPRDKASEVLQRIVASARSVGFLEDIKEKVYVSLQGAATPRTDDDPGSEEGGSDPDSGDSGGTDLASGEGNVVPIKPILQPSVPPTPTPPVPSRTTLATAIVDDERRRRVFITHGKNRDLVDPIKKLLEYGELEPVVSVEKQSVSKPVPEKVMDDMRGCGAAIIHVDADRTITDSSGEDHVLLNPNVLIEIGAAMAFYGRRFILLVREGVKLPSNLQGLYEVRYSGDVLDANATIKLLEAIRDIKNYGLPTDPPAADA
jgi:Predicted nucleotide-binding protein containing TIR-like domain